MLISCKGTFRQFDYGDCRNREIYNSTMPPEYPLRKATLPVAVFYGENDNMGPVKVLLIVLESLIKYENINLFFVRILF